MPRYQAPVYALNGGEVGTEALSRLDLDRLRYAGELYQNIFPKIVGSIQLRGGFQYLATSPINEAGNVFLKFVVGAQDNGVLQFSSDGMRIFNGEGYRSRAAVSTTVTNGTFADFTGWTDASSGSATATAAGGQLVLTGASGSIARARQEITVLPAEDEIEHGLNLQVDNGPVFVTIGTAAGLSDILNATALEEGFHSLGFTPGNGQTSVFLDIQNDQNKIGRVDNVSIAPTGPIVVGHPYSISDLRGLKIDQSNDVIFMASERFQQRRIERRSNTSWSIVRYKVDNGPFDILPDESITLTPSVTAGNGTLTASAPLFDTLDVGSIFRLQHFSQRVEDTLSAPGQTTDPIRVSGVGAADRAFSYSITTDGGGGTYDGSVVLERAFTEAVDFTTFLTFGGDNTTNNFNDGRDNQIVFYRFRMASITTGSADVVLDYAGGTTRGIARITGITSSTVANVEILSPFGATTGTNQWDRGSWSDRNGWPNAVTLFDGRLWWGRRGLVYGSVSDGFDDFDDETEGDSAPVIRSIGSNTSDGILWLLGLQRLAVGTNLAEVSIRASSFDEPITPTNFVPRDASTRGSANIAPVRLDSEAVYVQRAGDRVYRFAFTADKNDYFSYDLTELHREICESGILKIDVQRNPDTRIWFLLANGEVRCLVFELDQRVIAWTRIVTDGDFEDVAVLPSSGEDKVIALVKRNINGADVRYMEEMAPLTQAQGGLDSRIADSFIRGTNGPASATITGLSHLENEQVIVWATKASDSTVLVVDRDNMLTVTSGEITLSEAVTDWMVGLPYQGKWKSTKLAYGSAAGTALSQKKRNSHLNLLMENVYPDGVRIGRDFDALRGIRTRYKGRPLTANEFLPEYDYDASQLNGIWDTDARVCTEMNAPYSCTITGMVLHGKENDYGG